MNKLLFIFIDGVGLGSENKNNPMLDLFKPLTNKIFINNNFPELQNDFLLKPIDPVLNIQGIPQSATGQTSIMTGINSQKKLGYHHTAFPNELLIELIKDNNLLKELKLNNIKTTCANMYSKEYFEKRKSRKKNMLPVSALSIINAEINFRYIEDYNKGEAVFADITNNVIKSRGYDIDIITPETAALNMLNICKKNDFTFFEYFITDTYGHKKEEKKLKNEVDKLNRFITSLWNNGNNNLDIIITSDHGNCEDIGTGNHTTNPVPFLFISKDKKLKELYLKEVEDITHFKWAVKRYFNLD